MRIEARRAMAITLIVAATAGVRAAWAEPVALQVQSAGTTQLSVAPAGLDAIQDPELFPGAAGTTVADGPRATGAEPATVTPQDDSTLRAARTRMTNRSIARFGGRGDDTERLDLDDDAHAPLGFEGLNSRNQRLANGGNQFSTEPPDQALCVGNGYVLEAVNDVLRVYDTGGNALTGIVDLNTFFGYAPAIVRSTRTFGPFVTDPSCHFDRSTGRWFVSILTLGTNPKTGGFTGKGSLDLAVSSSSDPRGPWTLYRIPAQNDGTEGTPAHKNCPCIADYPHLGVDAHGVYITTNEFPFSGGFNSAQIYAISKRDLISGATSLRVNLIDTITTPFEGAPGFTVWPAVTPSGRFAREHDGTEYFLSSLAVFADSGQDHRLRIWALSNTKSLDAAKPALRLTHNVVDVARYAVPPRVAQKAGSTPLADCLNDRSLVVPGVGTGCWRLLVATQPNKTEVEESLDPNDSRMQQVMYEGGRLYAALDTAVTAAGAPRTGIAYFAIRPFTTRNATFGFTEAQGRVAVAGNNVTRPSIAVNEDGDGLIGFTLAGKDAYPSAAYVRLVGGRHAGRVRVVGPGAGPDDGFSGYVVTSGGTTGRWGDYSAAAVDGDAIWFSTEYIAQTCTLSEYLATPIGSCGGTRVALTNWSTRVTQVKFGD